MDTNPYKSPMVPVKGRAKKFRLTAGQVLLVAVLSLVVGTFAHAAGVHFLVTSRFEPSRVSAAGRALIAVLLSGGPLLMLFGAVAGLGAVMALAFRFVGRAGSRRQDGRTTRR